MTEANLLVPVEQRRAEMQAQANAQYGMARDIVYRTYLSKLNEYPVLPFGESGLTVRGPETTRLLEVTRIVYDARENALENLLNVFTALGCNYGPVLVIQSDGKQTHLYIGVRSYSDTIKASSGEKLLEQALEGHFSGTAYRGLKQLEIDAVLDCTEFTQTHPSWAISVAPGIPDLKAEEREHFTQGLERFIDAMRGKEYTAVVIAEPVDAHQLLTMQTGYEQMASALSVYQKQQMSVSLSDSEAVADTITEGFTNTVSESLTLSQTYTRGMSKTSSKSTGESHTSTPGGLVSGISGIVGGLVGSLVLPGVGTLIGSQIGGAIGGAIGSAMGSDTRSSNISESVGENESQADGRSKQEGTSEAESHQQSRGTTVTSGNTETLSLEQQNKSIVRLLERIDQQLRRLDESRAYGSWNASCYIIAGDTETASIGASIFMGALRGTNSGMEDSAIAVWNKATGMQRKRVLEYFEHLSHPCLRLSTIAAGQELTITPASLITGKELALLMNLPRKSVGGVTVLDGVAFGREKRTLAIAQEAEDDVASAIYIGKVRHLFRDQPQDVALNRRNLVYHTLITGTTGTGKSTAVKSILAQSFHQRLPFLVIEPAKDEFATLAALSLPDWPVSTYQAGRPGDDCLRLNPLVFPQDERITIIEHIDRVCALFNAAFPMYAAMPQILEEALIRAYERYGWDLLTSRTSADVPIFPTLRDVAELVPEVVLSAGYEYEAKSTYIGALTTRLRSLTRGALGLTFMANAADETRTTVLFDQSCIVNLSGIGSPEKKAVLMGLLMIRLQEHRIVQGQLEHDQLKHLMVIEEAHNLLKKTSMVQSQESSNPQGQAVEYFANALAEMRAYGQGFMIIDQSASALDTAVLRNTNTKIAFRAPFEEDRRIIGGALALDEKQTEMLARLEDHTTIVKQSNWLEAIQCHIDITPLQLPRPASHVQQVVTCTSIVKNGNEQLHRSCMLSALLCGPCVADPFDLGEVKNWIRAQELEESLEQLVLRTVDSPEQDLSLEDVRAILVALPVIGDVLRFTQQCSVSSRGMLNHVVIALREHTVFRGESLRELSFKLLRSFPTTGQAAELVVDLKDDSIW